MTKRKKALDNKCPACSAPIFFNPSVGKWKCEFCDSEFTLEQLQEFNNASSVENNKDEEKEKTEQEEKETVKTKEDGTTYVSYSCKNCGAEIIADEETAATFCVYCGNTAILKNKLSGEFKPSKVIPFKVEKKKAIEAFKNLSKGRPLVPKSFNNINNIKKITGVYIPFWLYDVKVSGSLNANGYKETSWTSGDTEYTKQDTYKIYRTGSMNYYKVPVDGSTRFDNDIMNSIEPFNYDELTDYNHAYLSGFLAEKYNVDSEASFKDAQERTLSSTRAKMLSDMKGYTSKTVFEDTLESSNTKIEYALLPVWMVNVKYNNEYYIFAMNGQTGEFVGNIPLDKSKAVMYGILVFVITFIFVSILSYIIYLI